MGQKKKLLVTKERTPSSWAPRIWVMSLSLFARAHCFAAPCCWIPDCSKFQGSRLQAQPLTNTTVIYLSINTSVSVSYDWAQQPKRAGMRGIRGLPALRQQRLLAVSAPLTAQGLLLQWGCRNALSFTFLPETAAPLEIGTGEAKHLA